MNTSTFNEMYEDVVNNLYDKDNIINKRLLEFGGKEKLRKMLLDEEKILIVTIAASDKSFFGTTFADNEIFVMTDKRFIYLKNKLFDNIIQEFQRIDSLSISWEGDGNDIIELVDGQNKLKRLLEYEGANKIKDAIRSSIKGYDKEKKSLGMIDFGIRNMTIRFTFVNRFCVSYTGAEWTYICTRKRFMDKKNELVKGVKKYYEDKYADFDDSMKANNLFSKMVIELCLDEIKSFVEKELRDEIFTFETNFTYEKNGEELETRLSRWENIKENLAEWIRSVLMKRLSSREDKEESLNKALEIVDIAVGSGYDVYIYLLKDSGIEVPFPDCDDDKAMDLYKAIVTLYEDNNLKEDDAIQKLCECMELDPYNQWVYAYMYKINKYCANDLLKLASDIGIYDDIKSWMNTIDNNPTRIPGFN